MVFRPRINDVPFLLLPRPAAVKPQSLLPILLLRRNRNGKAPFGISGWAGEGELGRSSSDDQVSEIRRVLIRGQGVKVLECEEVGRWVLAGGPFRRELCKTILATQ